ncbi:VOC family protein [Sphaerisporangium rubeum]|uniref:Putative enzyme related to lactoylglutathione lyase n=1 Tax=Sphaerisporangium rubeum TaxID=321317 RepID=A0A7X0IJ46_9ACTN|nr:VOC family protein [Sphaerisporangium rubeum]MBB6475629.1 putative enzyme related to lactoylglutathione lyase [Sphaerisporangium rubeum]
MTTRATFVAVTLDCASPKELAGFYAAITGYETQYASDDYAYIGDETHAIGFQRVDERKPAAWPGPDKQFHLDFRVPDVEQAVRDYVGLGATRPDFQPGDGAWVVLADPEGHLFCVCPPRT